MSDLNRILKLAGLPLNESISDDPAMNAEIERRLAAFPPAEQTRLLDALDALRIAGPAGLRGKQWSQAFAKMHADQVPTETARTLANCVQKFDCCVKNMGDGLFAWSEGHGPEGNLDDMDPAIKGAIKGQVDLNYRAEEMMRRMGTFTKSDIAAKISQSTGMSPMQADLYADHLLGVTPGLRQIGPGRYTIEDEKPHTNDDSMSMLRSIANGTFKG